MPCAIDSITETAPGTPEITTEADPPPAGRNYSSYSIVLEEERARPERRRRMVWVKPWLLWRTTLGHYDTLMQEFMRESRGDFKSYLRIEPAMFREMLDRLLPRITKSDDIRPALAHGLILAITLRFLATGDSYHSLAFNFRVAHNTISILVPQVCSSIVAEYKDEVLVLPSTPDAWREVASGFSRRWNYHHCCGAIDGKHVHIKKPKNSGTAYYNYKGFFSIVLLGLVDADYKFLWVNVGARGSMSDAGVYNESTLEPALREGTRPSWGNPWPASACRLSL